jgi:hypothetical protein
MRLLHAGRGRGRWTLPDGEYAAEEHRLWRLADGAALRLDGVDQVLIDPDGVVAIAGVRWARFDGRAGVGPPGDVHLWVGDGFLYRTERGQTTVIDALRSGERHTGGSLGAAVVGRTAWARVAPPGRAARPLPAPIVAGTERWSTDGWTLRGRTEDGALVSVDLRTGDARPCPEDDAVLEGATAVWDGWVAGPGGRVWSLRDERPVGESAVIPLGVAVGTPAGFVVVDWESNVGWTVPYAAPARTWPFTLPVDPDDTPVAARWDGGAVLVRTALGEAFAVVGDQVSRTEAEVPARPAPTALPSDLGPFLADGSASVAGITYAWNDDGWLVAL